MTARIAVSTDFYKTGHIFQYPKGTTQVFANWTARKSRIAGLNAVVFFGLQGYLLKSLIGRWNTEFFSQPKERVISRYARRMKTSGIDITVDHIGALHDLGYLPIEIWALPEGTRVPIGVAAFVMFNTNPDFFWVTNYIETDMSCNIWKTCTNATIAQEYRRIFTEGMIESGGPLPFVDWQGHDFSYRGMSGTEDAERSGAAHLLSFNGTDTIPGIDYLEEFYGADAEKEVIGGSVAATEHSVMCMGGKLGELKTYHRLLTEVYPTGIVSAVSDTWDYFHVLTHILPQLKEVIMNRPGTLVVRPDSGHPELILCGNPKDDRVAYQAGTYRILWDTFGGIMTEKNFKFLDSHIGSIYGDSITLGLARSIRDNLLAQRFVPSSVFGIGSFTYNHNTRDTFGHALKSTAGIVDGEVREIWKDPATDDGTKKSAKGYIAVYEQDGTFVQKDQVTLNETRNCAYRLVFKDSHVTEFQTLAQIRARVRS